MIGLGKVWLTSGRPRSEVVGDVNNDDDSVTQKRLLRFPPRGRKKHEHEQNWRHRAREWRQKNVLTSFSRATSTEDKHSHLAQVANDLIACLTTLGVTRRRENGTNRAEPKKQFQRPISCHGSSDWSYEGEIFRGLDPSFPLVKLLTLPKVWGNRPWSLAVVFFLGRGKVSMSSFSLLLSMSLQGVLQQQNKWSMLSQRNGRAVQVMRLAMSCPQWLKPPPTPVLSTPSPPPTGSGPIHTGWENANLPAIPLMLLASGVDTPIRNSKFHLFAFAPSIQCGLGRPHMAKAHWIAGWRNFQALTHESYLSQKSAVRRCGENFKFELHTSAKEQTYFRKHFSKWHKWSKQPPGQKREKKNLPL